MRATGGDNESTSTRRRRALLVGVTETRFLQQDEELAQRFPLLACADRDVELVGSALERSGYEVTAHHPGHAVPGRRDVSGSGIAVALHDFFSTCAPGDTAFVYISCHGESLRGRDFLVPADARPGAQLADGSRALLQGTLVAADPGELLTGLRAGVTTVVCLDMCRVRGPAPEEIAQTLLVEGDTRDVAWLHSSSVGEPSYADPAEGSHFGRALAEALSPATAPTTFGEVIAHTRRRARALSSGLPVRPPEITQYAPHLRQEAMLATPLCEGTRKETEWIASVTGSLLWEHTSGSAEAHARIKARLSDLVRAVAESRAGTGAHQLDPWGDPAYPERVERRLAQLVREARLSGADRLSPAETAALLAVPFLHEGAVITGLGELQSLLPLRLTGDGPAEPLTDHGREVVQAVHDVCRAHAAVLRTTETLRERGLTDAARAADHWLRHRVVADWDQLWERTGDYAGVDALVAMAVEAMAGGADEPGCRPLTDDTRRRVDNQLRQVAGHLNVPPGNSPRINLFSGQDAWNVSRTVPGNQWRGEDLAALLCVAGVLAADPRRMSSVLVDHLGAHRELAPDTVVSALQAEYDYERVGEEWEGGPAASGYGLAVRFPCPHPALHAAVESLAASADALVRSLRERWQRPGVPALLRGLPEEVTTAHLESRDGQYTTPLERFSMAEDEIRPLLMGTQLYGDRMLAVRELYQNALDACRHRGMRVLYGARNAGVTSDWEARITFSQGWDDDGRPYIQCEDNGTGMSGRKLVSMFARAGRRSEQDPDFVQERRNWRRAKLGDVAMNSRFGIGVFSYFMLADEVVVWTRAVDLLGRPAAPDALRADIQSGSGLLQVRPGAGDAPSNGGTRVRLYLAAEGAEGGEPPSLLDALSSVLWLSEHHVTATETDRDGRQIRHAEWTPGVLRSPEAAHWAGPPLPAGDGAWIVQGDGQLLLDGVVVKDAPATWGYVFNLRERHRPVPSVDRNQLLSYDTGAVRAALLAEAPDAVGKCDEVSLRWLWRLARNEPRLAVLVLESLPHDATAVLEADSRDLVRASGRFPLATVGCFPCDADVLRERPAKRFAGAPTLHRWQLARLGLDAWDQPPFVAHGYPDPAGLDCLLFLDGAPNAGRSVVAAAQRAGRTLGEVVTALRRYAVAGLAVPPVSATRDCADLIPDALDVDVHQASWHTGHHRRVLAQIAKKHGVHTDRVMESLERLRNFSPALPSAAEVREAGTPPPVPAVGLPAHQARIEELSTSEFTTHDRRVLSVDNDGRSPWLAGSVGLQRLLLTSARIQHPVGDVARRLEELAPRTGVTAPAVPPEAADWTVPPWYAACGAPIGEESPLIGPWQAVLAAWSLPGPHDQGRHADDLRRLDLCGVLTPECSALRNDVARQMCAPVKLLSMLSVVSPQLRAGARRHPRGVALLDRDGVSVETAARLSARTMTSVGEVLGSLREGKLHLPLELPSLPPGAHALSVTDDDLRAFGRRPVRTPSGRRPEVSITDLLGHVERTRGTLGESVRRLAGFAPLGFPAVPGDFTGPDAEALEGFRPDMYDFAAFEPGLLARRRFADASSNNDGLGPLKLVLIAGRFGRSLGEVYDRYAPFRCLGLRVGVRRPTAHEAGLVPDWRDVVVLTEELTGRAPALTGAVPPGHIAQCVAETDLTQAQVRSRLARYAGLFGFELPLPEGDPA
ncbi:wHTH domain-containing protein [Streptomyces albidochromogenes]|uniref:Caspase family protein n=1 Tax=Streptomyces albidochromogenes TaxID=329524 RepID=A0ABW6FJB4_9ACTN